MKLIDSDKNISLYRKCTLEIFLLLLALLAAGCLAGITAGLFGNGGGFRSESLYAQESNNTASVDIELIQGISTEIGKEINALIKSI